MSGPTAAIRAGCPNATPNNDGLMSAAHAAKIDKFTFTKVYNEGISVADQTANISPVNGGPIIVRAATTAVGSLLRALTSAAVVVLDAVDDVFPKLFGPGVIIQNNPDFESPQIFGNDSNKSLYVTADGNGSVRGGTGVGMFQDDIDPTKSFVETSVNDEAITVVLSDGMFPISTASPEIFLGGPGTADTQSWAQIWSKLFCGRVGDILAINTNTITPTFAIHHVGTGLIKNITVPFTGFTGSIVLWPDAAFTYDNTGNISVAAGGGTAVVNKVMIATYDGTSWGMSY